MLRLHKIILNFLRVRKKKQILKNLFKKEPAKKHKNIAKTKQKLNVFSPQNKNQRKVLSNLSYTYICS